jgi:NADH-quinone oxidoreductase subunit I
MLTELLKGMMLTGRHMFSRKVTVQFPRRRRRRARASAACSAAPLPERRGALHRVQAVRGGVPGAAILIESEVARRRHRRTTRYDIDLTKCIFCGFCEEACPVDAIVETRVLEYHGEKRGDCTTPRKCCSRSATATKDQIAKDRAADARYR